MKKLVKLILLCLIAYPIISIVSSCSEEEDCSMNARPRTGTCDSSVSLQGK